MRGIQRIWLLCRIVLHIRLCTMISATQRWLQGCYKNTDRVLSFISPRRAMLTDRSWGQRRFYGLILMGRSRCCRLLVRTMIADGREAGEISVSARFQLMKCTGL